MSAIAWIFRRRPRSPLQWCVGAALTFYLVLRPVQLSSTQWWQSPALSASINLTDEQRLAIEHLYRDRLVERRRCTERLVESINQLDQLLYDGVDLNAMMKGTESLASAAAEQQQLLRRIREQIAAILSDDQRDRLLTTHGRIFE